MVGLNEQEAYEQLIVSLETCLNNSDLMANVQVTNLTAMMNEGLLTGQPLSTA